MAEPSGAIGDSEPKERVTGVAALYVADDMDDTDPFYDQSDDGQEEIDQGHGLDGSSVAGRSHKGTFNWKCRHVR